MAFNRPTLAQLVQRITTDLETSYGIVGAALRNSFIKLFGKVIAGAAHLLHGNLDWISKQILPSTADDENLLRWASTFGLERNEASFAEGTVTFTGTNETTIPEGTELVSADGVVFRTTGDGAIESGEADIDVIAEVAGESGNSAIATVLSLAAPLAGVDPETTVSVAIAGGADQETIEELRTRLLERIQSPPLGGAQQDYIQWAKETTGVTRAWCYPAYLGAGTVGVFFMRDNDADPFPSESEVETVSAYIETKRPVTAQHYVFAPTAQEVDFSIAISPDTAEVRAAVEAELQDLFDRDAEPGGIIYLSRIREAVSVAAGETDNSISNPSADIDPSNGYIATMGTVTWA